MMMKFELKLLSTKSLKFIFTKMSIILDTLNLLAANIYSTLLCSESQGMKLCSKVQCIFHSAGCDSAALLHKSHGQCDLTWMQAVWHGNFPIVLTEDFCTICKACILITMFNLHPPSYLYHHSLHPLSPTSSLIVHFSLSHIPHCFLSCPLSCCV